MSKKVTKEDFVERANKLHNNKYDYSKFDYITSTTPSIIICPEHGEFLKDAHHHLRGQGCPKCSRLIKGVNHRLTQEQFIQKVQNIFPEYIFTKTNYTRYVDPVIVICPKHGEFEIKAAVLTQGQGCPKCGRENTLNSIKLSEKDIIERAKQIHGDKYDYSKVKYNTGNKIEIICPEHGSFYQRYDAHLSGQGCPLCKSSKGEQLIINLLEDNNIDYIPQYEIDINPSINPSGKAYIDFYLPQYNIAIEYNGTQHYKYIPYFHKGGIIDFEKQQKRDLYVKNYCEENNINLIEIKYSDNILEKLELIGNRKHN